MNNSNTTDVHVVYMGDEAKTCQAYLRPGQYRILSTAQLQLPKNFVSAGFWCRMTDTDCRDLPMLDFMKLNPNWYKNYSE